MKIKFFFFQAEDGIRDHCVTGVQTCALPIFARAERDVVVAGAAAQAVASNAAADGRVALHRRSVERHERRVPRVASGQAR